MEAGETTDGPTDNCDKKSALTVLECCCCCCCCCCCYCYNHQAHSPPTPACDPVPSAHPAATCRHHPPPNSSALSPHCHPAAPPTSSSLQHPLLHQKRKCQVDTGVAAVQGSRARQGRGAAACLRFKAENLGLKAFEKHETRVAAGEMIRA